MRGRAVAIIAKAPRPGHVKTRLCPPLSPVDAARLHDAFLRDTIERVRSLADVQVVLAYTPAEDRDSFAPACEDAILLPQADGDLGQRLIAVFDALRARDFGCVLAIGADTPTLPVVFLREALALLDRPDVDVVLGPAEDGGYYLVGLSSAHPDLFRAIPWSTGEVFAETKRRAACAGLRVVSLPSWWDVDTFDDLRRLVELVRVDPSLAPHTRAVLIEERLL